MYKIYIENINNINIINLPSSFNTYINRIKNEERLKVSIKAYSLLLDKLESDFKIDIKNEELVFNEYKKPYLKVNKDIYFNISHSKDMIAIIISDKECGIDIEYINPNINLNVTKKYLSNSELDIFNKTKEKIDYLFLMWTKKEAYFKKLGTGLDYKILKEERDYSNINSKIILNNNDKYYVSVDI